MIVSTEREHMHTHREASVVRKSPQSVAVGTHLTSEGKHDRWNRLHYARERDCVPDSFSSVVLVRVG